MAKKLNTRGILNVLGFAVFNPVTLVVGFVGGIVGLAILANSPSEEEVQTANFQRNELAIYDGSRTFNLVNEDIIRLTEGDLMKDFHFASGHIYVQTVPFEYDPDGQNARIADLQILDFDDVLNETWINEVKEMGCRISENLSADDFTADVPQEELENAIDGAEGFLEQHCN